LVIADRDQVDWTNLPRQVLFEDRHAEQSTPKVMAAMESLQRMGGPTRIEPHATHVDADNLAELAGDCDLILDGTDNLATRYLINDFCVSRGVPWIYAGVIGGNGLVMPGLPVRGACLRCLFPEPPPPGSMETCDTAGVLMPAVGTIASFASGLALRLLIQPDVDTHLVEFDVWHGSTRQLSIPKHAQCPACAAGEFPYLNATLSERTLSLCGRNTIQVRGRGVELNLESLLAKLQLVDAHAVGLGPLVRAELEGHRVTIFRDGRALIEGTEDEGRALAIYDRYLA